MITARLDGAGPGHAGTTMLVGLTHDELVGIVASGQRKLILARVLRDEHDLELADVDAIVLFGGPTDEQIEAQLEAMVSSGGSPGSP